MCLLELADFDPRTNFAHALECLKSLLLIYEEEGNFNENSCLMSAIYLMLNLGSTEADTWGICLPKKLKCGPQFYFLKSFAKLTKSGFIFCSGKSQLSEHPYTLVGRIEREILSGSFDWLRDCLLWLRWRFTGSYLASSSTVAIT